MIQGEQDGFTIIEVMLFLSVSALLLLVALAFTGSTLRNARFTDATKTMQSFLQEQYTRVQTNSLSLSAPSGSKPNCHDGTAAITNDGSYTSTGTSQSCILLGSALDFNGTTIDIYPVLGYAQSGGQTLGSVNPQVWTAAGTTYTLAWQSSVSNVTSLLMKNIKNNDTINTKLSVDRLLFLREIASSSINMYATTQAQQVATVVDIDVPSNTRNVPTLVCVSSGDGGATRGAVKIQGSGTEMSTNINAISSSVVPTSTSFFTEFLSGGITCA